ncbi:phage minor capsid protein [Sporosarcina sp. FSL K6-2383]|uniref:phage minor capsid protein n=1 Tax=Sporosarcina sp. FSL K6-2383 TaxID=2921556 RepID=UPI00315A73CD
MKPKITPHQLDLWSGNMSDLYQSLEGDIIRIIIKRLNTGYRDIAYWQAEKLADLHLFNNDVTRLLAEVTNVAEPEIRRMFEEVGRGIVEDIDNAMPYPTKPVPTNLDNVMRAYHNQAWGEIDNYVNQTLVTTQYGAGTAQRAYVDVLNKTSAAFNTGLYTMEQSVERAITDLAQKGIKSTFVDKGGNHWSLEGYMRTVMKSTLGNTYDTLRKDRMDEYGVHTVVVTSMIGSASRCVRIQGNVVDLRETSELPPDSEYKSIYDSIWQADYGEAGGHRGVNCRHLHVPFIPGVNTNNQPKIDPKSNEEIANARDTQRRIEREILKYKKNLIVAEAMKSDTAAHWRMMVSRRQMAMRSHLAANPEYLRRNYKREKVYTPLKTLLGDFSYDN